METAHMALHLSEKFTRRILVVQPRRADGTFQSPVTLLNSVTIPTVHLTINGQVAPISRYR